MRNIDEIEEFVSLAQKIRKRLHQEYHKVAEGYGLTIPQLHALVRLWHKEPQSITELSDFLDLAPSTVCGIVDRLELKGLVRREREGEDRRLVAIKLTAQGRQLKDKLSCIVKQEYLSKVFSHLNQTERKQLLAVLRKIYHLMTLEDK
jgi:DNA-binding MarR family transcriptional regulator